MSGNRASLALIALYCLLLCSTGSCADGMGMAADAPQAEPQAESLPPLPQDGRAWHRQVSEVTTLMGAASFDNSGEPGAKVHSTVADWLTLDGDSAGHFAWAIWQFPISADTEIQKLQINLQQSGLKKFHFAVADYSQGKWVFPLLDDFPDGVKGVATLELGADDGQLHSPGENVYVAALVLPGNKINVSSVELTVEDTGGGNDDPIFDDFENNDTLETAYPLPGPGSYHCSLHETAVEDMSDPNELIDRMDFFTVPVQAGQTLTATLEFEVTNRFPEVGEPLLNDFDLLLYPPGATLELDQFNEDASGLEIYFYPFEHGSWTVNAGGEYMIGVIAMEEGHDNGEYWLNIFVEEPTYTVEGYVTKQGASASERFVAYLEPGGFNCVTSLDPELPGEAGKFVIEGVPVGVYTLKVHSSASFHENHPFFWPEEEVVIVSNTDVDVGIDIGPEPE